MGLTLAGVYHLFTEKITTLKFSVASLATMGTIVKVDATKKAQTATVTTLEGEKYPNIPIEENYGFSSVAGPKAEHIMLSLGGLRDNARVILQSLRAYRPRNLKLFEVIVYHKLGSRFYLRDGGHASVVPAGAGKVHIGAETALLEAARVTDPVASSPALAAYLAGLNATVNALIVKTAGLPGVVPPLVAVPTDIGRISDGSSTTRIA